jgi:uncharacterized protein YdhG (YjbR/CyaY superfamily)
MPTPKRASSKAKPQKAKPVPGKTVATRMGRAKTVPAYLAALAPDKRAALETLRLALKKLLPKAEDAISYGIPALKHPDGVVVYYAASAKHCSLFPTSWPIEACAADLKGYDTSKGTLRFPADKGLPAALLKKLVRARLDQMAQKRARG